LKTHPDVESQYPYTTLPQPLFQEQLTPGAQAEPSAGLVAGHVAGHGPMLIFQSPDVASQLAKSVPPHALM
jgi:hypothetical protein